MKTPTLGRILLIDDDDWIIAGVSVALTHAGFQVVSAINGRKGLEAALWQRPDLIISDIVMPEMDGWTFLRHIRSVPRFALIPLLLLTSKGAAQDRVAGYQMGADDYLDKPVNFTDLPRRVMKALAHRRQLEQDLALPAERSEGKGLKGTLDQVGMATLLNILSTGCRSGILRLTGGTLAGEALIYLVRGQIYRVEVQGKGRLTSDEALRQVFGLLEGGFEFSPMALRLPNEVNVSTNTLLLQGAVA